MFISFLCFVAINAVSYEVAVVQVEVLEIDFVQVEVFKVEVVEVYFSKLVFFMLISHSDCVKLEF